MEQTPQTENNDSSPLRDDAGISAVAASMETIAQVEARKAARRKHQSSLWNYPATYSLMGINFAVFAVMTFYGPLPELVRQGQLSGMLTTPFDADTLVRFGATASWMVQQGQWWRLVTGAFVHVTLLHILLNMWCLWNLGLFGEPLLGKRGLVAVYLLTGTAGMLLSYTMSVVAVQPALVAGASGAVFGIAGILIVLLSNRGLAVPWEELKKLRRQVIFFAVINLVLGVAPDVLAMSSAPQLSGLQSRLPRIDNSAHLGGFLSGLALGWPLFGKMTAGRESYRHRQTITFVLATLAMCLYAYALAKFV